MNYAYGHISRRPPLYSQTKTIAHTQCTNRMYTDKDSLPSIHDVRQLQILHDNFVLRGTRHVYLIYNGNHYNPIQYGNTSLQEKNFNMPIWVTSQQTRRRKRTCTTTAMNDSDSDSNRINNREEHNIDEESNTVRHNQKKIKTEQKTRILQCKKKEEDKRRSTNDGTTM